MVIVMYKDITVGDVEIFFKIEACLIDSGLFRAVVVTYVEDTEDEERVVEFTINRITQEVELVHYEGYSREEYVEHIMEEAAEALEGEEEDEEPVYTDTVDKHLVVPETVQALDYESDEEMNYPNYDSDEGKPLEIPEDW